MKKNIKIFSTVIIFISIIFSCHFIKFDILTKQNELFALHSLKSYDSIANVPPFTKEPFVILNNNKPNFSKKDLTTKSFEKYSPLDVLGRCGPAVANIGTDLMPTEERGNIGMVKPTGWHTVKYDNVDGKYLYNRCHLIGYQLTGENANIKNLITGTRYLNNEGMLPFEEIIVDYVKETNNHVLYRVTPIFKGENLLASGVQLEAISVEDKGKQICFNVYVYNAHPQIFIDYKTGDSYHENVANDENNTTKYIINIKSKKIHKTSCSAVKTINEINKKETEENIDELFKQGYTVCQQCKPL